MVKSTKIKTKNKKDIMSESILDEILNCVEQKCKCKVVKPNETTWILDGSECNLCHEKIL